MSIRRFARLLAIVLMTVTASGMSSGGCPTTFDAQALANTQNTLAGLWTISRGQVEATFGWTVDSGGEIKQEYASHVLEPLDPADFPTALASLVQQWNAGLTELNAKLDAAFPAEVLITFPGFAQIRVSDANDPMRTGLGGINSNDEYIFVGDLTISSGTNDQGAGAELQAATIEGKINRAAQTMTGKVARTLIVLLHGASESSTTFTVKMIVKYTGVRSGPLP